MDVNELDNGRKAKKPKKSKEEQVAME